MKENSLHVAMLLPEEKNCGIVTYSNYLLTELQRLKHLHVEAVINHAGSDRAKYAALAEALARGYDITHVQFEFARFGKWIFSGVGAPFLYATFPREAIVVTTLHDLPPRNQPLIQAVQRFLLSFVMGKSQRIIVHTDESAKQLQHLFPAHASKVVVIPHGMLDATPLRTKKGLPTILKGKKIIGAFGFPAPHKNFEAIIDALTELPKDYVAVMGVGAQTPAHTAYLEHLKAYARERKVPDRITWHGFVEEAQMPAFFSWLDVVVFPYSRVTESGALALALAHRKAVIARGLPTFREIAEKHQCIQLFSTPGELVQQIRELVEHAPARKQLIANIEGMVSTRNWKAVAGQHEALYMELHKGQGD